MFSNMLTQPKSFTAKSSTLPPLDNEVFTGFQTYLTSLFGATLVLILIQGKSKKDMQAVMIIDFHLF
jgi:hypothetical protein